MGLPLARSTSYEDCSLVFARLARELAALAAASDTLQDTLANTLAASAEQVTLDADALQSLQGLDLLTQTLDALGLLMARLGDDPTTTGHVDLGMALQAVPLSGLASRLAGGHGDVGSDMEFDLF